ncbi:hypothetical protein [Flavilitoribacter nigricans]|uniref:Uncharacterized protein n=1 Tax=Flavilitoribacter nigricans (strain ATCC 23147 / DSM 23189 / NBRC 102662 / NCIMB 1420 / SS-2) TaxID=1122177 RepID=A0A2D0N4L7_FLAN2|nr:hypothetical protein [Flavilitoribacter nigricans]PHN03482.1 hypothetical protein CRP01_26120 [Flavilitoribacter nigricans DSM 23189 = NBRC 102662]
MENISETLGGLIIVGGAVAIVYILARFNYLIRKAAYERGIELSSRQNKYRYVDYGCILLGLGIGLAASSFFTLLDLKEDTMDLLVWATILIFGALGLIATHFIRKTLED